MDYWHKWTVGPNGEAWYVGGIYVDGMREIVATGEPGYVRHQVAERVRSIRLTEAQHDAALWENAER